MELDIDGAPYGGARRVATLVQQCQPPSSMIPHTDVPLLKELKVARATGGSIFHVTPDQWDTLMEIVGGWPGSTPK